jgi:F-type H+-transporting ATPase subunit a
MKSPLEQFDILNVKNFFGAINDFSFNNIMLPFILIIILFFFFIILILQKKAKIIPSDLQNILETDYRFIIGIIKQQAGIKGLLWTPFIFVIFNFILFSNLLSLIPFGIALTSHLIIILWLSITICISIFCIGLLNYNLKFLHIFIPQCPFVLLPILIPIEIFSYLIRLFSLAIRLAANILAGHTLVHIIVAFILNMMKIEFFLSLFILIPLFLILTLEFGVAFLQAYVFTVLISIYLSDSLKSPYH